MSEPDNIVLQHLRMIREQLDTLNERQLETMQRIGTIEVQMANLTTQIANLTTQMANLSVRVDRIDARLDRVEHRLGLIEV